MPVLQDAARRIVEAGRGQRRVFVLVYAAPADELGRMGALDAGVGEQDRALLSGHAIEGMPRHYATATLARLVDAANKVTFTVDRSAPLRVVNG